MKTGFCKYTDKQSDSVLLFTTTALLLLFVRLRGNFTILLGDRLFPYGGYIQILLMSFFAVWIYNKLNNPAYYALYRKRLWLLFCFWFFLQFLLGIWVSDIFLLTGKLHFPFPFMIVSGAAYRTEVGFMIILFLVTILLSGSAWCSHLCYFGGFDSWASGNKYKKRQWIIPIQWGVKLSVLFLSVLLPILFLITETDIKSIITVIIIAGFTEITIMLFISRQQKRMVHCTWFCPIGTIVAITKFINPLRIRFNNNCTHCGKCIPACKYNAITSESIRQQKFHLTCTRCGDCKASCPHNAIEYKYNGISPSLSHRIFLITVSIFYVLFFSLARI